MKPKQENLTNERLGKRFPSQFDLVNYAIHLASSAIHAGREPQIKGIRNLAYNILEEISVGKDIIVTDTEEEEDIEEISNEEQQPTT